MRACMDHMHLLSVVQFDVFQWIQMKDAIQEMTYCGIVFVIVTTILH